MMVDEVAVRESPAAAAAVALGRWSVLFYGVGHMLNDITAACWFTYLLVFMTDIGLSPRDAATVMLSGQIADGFTTIFAGELIDRFGHFKIWHAGGSILVAVSFSSVFGSCIPCLIFGSESASLQTIGYSFFAAVFNVGWAATQVSHMSMVNCITLNSTSRVVMTSCRNAFSMVANLSLYAIAFLVFHLSPSKTTSEIENQYRWIAYTSIFIGCCFVVIFHIGTGEPRLKEDFRGHTYQKISWTYWFKKVLYYQVALVYVFTRLITNVSQAFLAFYVINDLRMAQSSKASIPAMIYICSFIVSIALQVTGVSMQSYLVGEDVKGCAFVYGSLSFLDKVSCGFALWILESYQNTNVVALTACTPICSCYSISRYGFGLVPAVCALVAVVVTCTMKLEKPRLRPLKVPLLE
ncbi:major facilitator superfamily domain-containing protein 12-like protein [Tanacetum coccineum]|uniref:Major facilitator superfamily domain-containing protein 12-like protein n=1 Tax=Tanacetum coccineum TaxID=301880 RepID=A0ABQ5FR21_9ASTR